MLNVSFDMKDSPDEVIFDFIQTRVNRIQWLIDRGFYEDANFLHRDTREIAKDLDLDLV